jgi:hypothetical protein
MAQFLSVKNSTRIKPLLSSINPIKTGKSAFIEATYNRPNASVALNCYANDHQSSYTATTAHAGYSSTVATIMATDLPSTSLVVVASSGRQPTLSSVISTRALAGTSGIVANNHRNTAATLLATNDRANISTTMATTHQSPVTTLVATSNAGASGLGVDKLHFPTKVSARGRPKLRERKTAIGLPRQQVMACIPYEKKSIEQRIACKHFSKQTHYAF